MEIIDGIPVWHWKTARAYVKKNGGKINRLSDRFFDRYGEVIKDDKLIAYVSNMKPLIDTTDKKSLIRVPVDGLTAHTLRDLQRSGADLHHESQEYRIEMVGWSNLSILSQDEVRHANCLRKAREDLEKAHNEIQKQEDILCRMRKRIALAEETVSDYAYVSRAKVPRPVSKKDVSDFKAKKADDKAKLDESVQAAQLLVAKVLAAQLKEN